MRRGLKEKILRFFASFMIAVTLLTTCDLTGVVSLFGAVAEKIGAISEQELSFLQIDRVMAAGDASYQTLVNTGSISGTTISSEAYGSAQHGDVYNMIMGSDAAFCLGYGQHANYNPYAYKVITPEESGLSEEQLLRIKRLLYSYQYYIENATDAGYVIYQCAIWMVMNNTKFSADSFEEFMRFRKTIEDSAGSLPDLHEALKNTDDRVYSYAYNAMTNSSSATIFDTDEFRNTIMYLYSAGSGFQLIASLAAPVPLLGTYSGIMIAKVDAVTGQPVQSQAEFKVYSDAACTQEVTETEDPLTGDRYPATFSYDGNGVYSVELYGLEGDTYYVKEVSAPYGYYINGGVATVVLPAPENANTQQYLTPGDIGGGVWPDQPWSFVIEISKDDEETYQAIQNNAKFLLQAANGTLSVPVTFTKVSGDDPDNCVYRSSTVYYNESNGGNFVLYEQQAPEGYYGDWVGDPGVAGSTTGKAVYSFNLNANNTGTTVSKTIINEESKGRLTLNKYDIEADKFVNDFYNGETTLTGTIYGLYAKEDINYPDGFRGIAHNAGDLVAVSAIDENGELIFDDLYLGKYYVQEMYIQSSVDDKHLGFYLNDENGDMVTGDLMYYDWDFATKTLVCHETDTWKAFNESGLFTSDGNGGYTAQANVTYTALQYTGYHADDTKHDADVLYISESVDIVDNTAESYDQVIKGKLSFYKYESSEVSNGYESLEGAGFTLYRIDKLSRFDESWYNADGTLNIGLIRNAYMSRTAGATYDENGNLVVTPIYDFSDEDDAIATFYAYNSTQSSVTHITDGSGTDLTNFYWNELQADIEAGRVTSLGDNLYRVNELYSDDYGLVTTPYIPFGDYLVVETTVPADHEQAAPFVLECCDNKDTISEGINENTAMGTTFDGSRQQSGTPFESWYGYGKIVLDKIVNMRVWLSKFDGDTQQLVLNPTAVYRMYQINTIKLNNAVVDSPEEWEQYKAANPQITFTTTTMNYAGGITEEVETWTEINYLGYEVSYELRILDGVYYRCLRIQNEVDEDRTDTFITHGIYEDGVMVDCYLESQQLEIGTYLVEEEEAPEGFYNDRGYYITFNVTTNREYSIDMSLTAQGGREYTFPENYYDDEVVGHITMYKRGEVLTGIKRTAITDEDTLEALGTESADVIDFVYEENYVPGAKYAIIANEDIVTQDCQIEKDADGNYVKDENGEYVRTTWFKKGDVIAIVSTGEEAQNTSLYVIYDGTTPSVSTTYNEATGEYDVVYYGQSTGTYTQYENGHPIVKVTVDAEGKVGIDLPLGSYTIEEVSVGHGLTVTKDTYNVTFEWVDQFTPVVENTAEVQVKDDVVYDTERTGETGAYSEDGLVFTNDRIGARTKLTKLDEANGEPLEGVVFGLYTKDNIYDYRGNVLINASELSPVLLNVATTNKDGEVLFPNDLPVGYYYTDATGVYEVGGTVDFTTKDGKVTMPELVGLEEKTGYTCGGMEILAPVVYQDVFAYAETENEEKLALITYLKEHPGVVGDDVIISGTDVYEVLLESTVPETFEEQVEYGDYVFVLVDDVLGTYALYEKQAGANTGNYIIKEEYTDYGIWLEDTDYALSFQLYYDANHLITDKIAGTTAPVNDTDVMYGIGRVFNITTEVYISKKDLSNAASLPGATMTIRDNATGETVATWVTSGNNDEFRAFRINDTLPATATGEGTYTLREVAAPSGYKVNMNDIHFAITKVYDENGVLIPYKNETYIWYTNYKETEVGIVKAVGSYDGLQWEINENGELHLFVAEEDPDYVFQPRAYVQEEILDAEGNPVLDAEGNPTYNNIPTTLFPWEEVMYETDETGAQILDANGDPIPLDLKVNAVVVDDRITFAMIDETTACTDQYFACTFLDVFQRSKVVQVIVDEGWELAENVNLVIMYDEKTSTPSTPPTSLVRVSKQLITGSNELEGAKLTVYDASGNVVDSWVSTSVPHYIYGLTVGHNYRLVEDYSPLGYGGASEIWFTVTKDYTTQVTMKDDYTKVEISKQSITGSKELPGATLTLTDKVTGEVIDTWVSGTEPHVLTNVCIAGREYVLTEVMAPEGYRIAESITFTVNTDSTTTYVVMKDAPDVKTADGTTMWLYILCTLMGLGSLSAGGYLYLTERKKRKI